MTTATKSKPGRNQPCWCGSGAKYKKCHLEADEAERDLQSVASGLAEPVKAAVGKLASLLSRTVRPSRHSRDATDRRLLALGAKVRAAGAQLVTRDGHLSVKLMVGPREVLLQGDYAVGFVEASAEERRRMLAEIREAVRTGRPPGGAS